MKAPLPLPALKFVVLTAASLVVFAPDGLSKGSAISYSPVSQEVEGVMPFVSTQALAITAPSDLTPGVAVTVGVRVDAAQMPGGTAAMALSYVTCSPATLTFTQPGQTVMVEFKVKFPDMTVGASPGLYIYQVSTTGWTTAEVDTGATVAVTATVPTIVVPPAVTILTPADGLHVTVSPEQLPLQLPFKFQASADPGSPISAVDATCASAPVMFAETTGLGTGTVVASGYATVWKGGHYPFAARAGNAAGVTKETNEFIVEVVAKPPQLSIGYPAPGSVFVYQVGGAPATPAVTFTASSAYGALTGLTATVDGQPVPLVPVGLGGGVVTGTINLSYAAAGLHTVAVTATDDFSSVTRETSFNVVADVPPPAPMFTLGGRVYFDMNRDGMSNPLEYGMAGIPVTLVAGSCPPVSTTTRDDGSYSFTDVPAGGAIVTVAPYAGIAATKVTTRSVTVGTVNLDGVDFGVALDFVALAHLPAEGLSVSFWKSNLEKAVTGKMRGAQIPADRLLEYTAAIGELALSPFDDISTKAARTTISRTRELSAQLLAAEYNYMNGAYIADNRPLTFAFIWWGESVLANQAGYTREYLSWVNEWFKSYNMSHGHNVDGPKP